MKISSPSLAITSVLAIFAICAGPANADNFQITITPTSAMLDTGDPYPLIPGSGSFSTNGVCSICTTSTPGEIQAFHIEFNSGNTFDLSDPFTGGLFSYDVTTHALNAHLSNFGLEVFIALPDATFTMDFDGVVFEKGTYAVSEVPEPGSVLLLSAILIAVVLQNRDRQKAHAVRPHAGHRAGGEPLSREACV